MRVGHAALGLAALSLALTCAATELVYTPVNPAFGGNPLNGPYLLNNAQAQDTFKDPDAPTPFGRQTPLERFTDTLQRSILNRIASSITANIVGPGGELQPGTIETTDFIIEVIDIGGGAMQIITTDKTTGDTTSFEINTLF